MKQTYFMTGFPGYLATSLIKQLIDDYQQDIEHIYLLVLPQMESKANEEISKFTRRENLKSDLFTVLTGDITKPELNISHKINTSLKSAVTHVFHLAAIYDLAVPKEIAFEVNVNGTENVNDWVKTLAKLKRYIYFSTAYVSGTREGRIYEHELAKGQSFKNHYEHTKYEAEIRVNKIIEDVPTTIIRPGVVKGHSKTGATTKFDGLYFMLNFLDNLSFLPFIPYFGDGKPEGNFVPADYVLRATSYLAINPIGAGKTYHLADPNPYTMRELQRMLSEHYLGRTPQGKIPVAAAKAPLAFAPIRKWLQAEPEAMDYFIIDASFDCSQAVTDLEGSGITCPDLKDTLDSMIYFYRKYRHDRSRHIQIK